MIDHENRIPVLSWRGSIWVIDTSGRATGTLIYTKFDDASTPVHTVYMPFSFAHTLGELIMRGEGMREKVAPIVQTIPPAAFAII